MGRKEERKAGRAEKKQQRGIPTPSASARAAAAAAAAPNPKKFLPKPKPVLSAAAAASMSAAAASTSSAAPSTSTATSSTKRKRVDPVPASTSSKASSSKLASSTPLSRLLGKSSSSSSAGGGTTTDRPTHKRLKSKNLSKGESVEEREIAWLEYKLGRGKKKAKKPAAPASRKGGEDDGGDESDGLDELLDDLDRLEGEIEGMGDESETDEEEEGMSGDEEGMSVDDGDVEEIEDEREEGGEGDEMDEDEEWAGIQEEVEAAPSLVPRIDTSPPPAQVDAASTTVDDSGPSSSPPSGSSQPIRRASDPSRCLLCSLELVQLQQRSTFLLRSELGWPPRLAEARTTRRARRSSLDWRSRQRDCSTGWESQTSRASSTRSRPSTGSTRGTVSPSVVLRGSPRGRALTLLRVRFGSDVTSTLTKLILETISSHANLLDSFVVLYATLVAGLYKIIGIEFGTSCPFFFSPAFAHTCTHLVSLLSSFQQEQALFRRSSRRCRPTWCRSRRRWRRRSRSRSGRSRPT